MFPKLVKGDEEHLQGRAIIYSNCERNGLVLGTFAMYLAARLEDYVCKMNVGPEAAGVITKRWEERSAELKRSFGAGGFLPFYNSQMPDLSEEEILASEEDVVFTGNYDNPVWCAQTINAAIPFYVLPFIQQDRRGMPASIHGLESRIVAWETPQLANAEIEFLAHIAGTYVMPMMFTQITGHTRGLEAVASQFREYCGQFNLGRDAERLCEIIQSMGGDGQIGIVQRYLQKMGAIVAQRYEAAARLRDEIGQLETRA